MISLTVSTGYAARFAFASSLSQSGRRKFSGNGMFVYFHSVADFHATRSVPTRFFIVFGPTCLSPLPVCHLEMTDCIAEPSTCLNGAEPFAVVKAMLQAFSSDLQPG